jgi:23S rRNA (uracil1939-C5)-methyltransferase
LSVVRILRLAAGGEGVGRLDDGRAVFVPRTAPGDLVEVTFPRLAPRYARARLARLVEPGPGRVAPRCPHYLRDDCGGCQWQHLDLTVQRESKRAIVADALRRIAGLDVPVEPVIGGEAAWGYRSRVTLAVGPGRRHAGYHPLDQPGRVFALERCDLAAPALMVLWEALRRHLQLLPPDVQQLVLRLDRAGHLHLVVKARGDRAWARPRELMTRMQQGGVTATIWWQPARGAARVVAGAGEAFPATVFEQVNPELGDRIRTFAIDCLGDVRGSHVWDLFAGIGETTDQLFGKGATVESVELDRRAVEFGESRSRAALRERAESQRPEPAGVLRHVGRVEDLVDNLRAPGAVIANPPRAGMHIRVTRALLERRPERIVYVSCDPATLARDLGRLCGSAARSPDHRTAEPPFRLTAVQPFDLFPQTAHVETVALLEA